MNHFCLRDSYEITKEDNLFMRNNFSFQNNFIFEQFEIGIGKGQNQGCISKTLIGARVQVIFSLKNRQRNKK